MSNETLDEKGFAFHGDDGKPYLCRMHEGVPWFFYWNEGWVTLKPVNAPAIHSANKRRMTPERQAHYETFHEDLKHTPGFSDKSKEPVDAIEPIVINNIGLMLNRSKALSTIVIRTLRDSIGDETEFGFIVRKRNEWFKQLEEANTDIDKDSFTYSSLPIISPAQRFCLEVVCYPNGKHKV